MRHTMNGSAHKNANEKNVEKWNELMMDIIVEQRVLCMRWTTNCVFTTHFYHVKASKTGTYV